MSRGGRNRLDQAASPYLLQHRDNPVHWWEWGEAALEVAAKENKPILLSIGYAACHWCHVMAHESFEKQDIADLMNRLFISIKVDREERPDLDAVYQQALALLGQQGGWPLTMFLSPDGKPFWGGTYFPPESRWGRPGFSEILEKIAAIYRDEPEKVAANSRELMAAMSKLARPQMAEGEIGADLRGQIAERLLQEQDPLHGGIGTAPKFPQIPVLELLWRAFLQNGDQRFKEAVIKALRAMCQGGIYDHLGGGMARYATDAAWLVPHFEKMLYDNASLLHLLALVGARDPDPLWKERAAEVVAFLQREMRAAIDCPAFASSWDADSEGIEGKYYVWQEQEIDALLGKEADFFKKYYDVSAGGNWEGQVILNRLSFPTWQGEEVEARLRDGCARLREARDRRVKPGFDDKVLTDWNGMAIQALCRASLVFHRPDWLEEAKAVFAFLVDHLQDNGHWYHSWRQGKKGSAAMLDDHAHLALAALCLHEATAEDKYLHQAEAQASILDEAFWDEKDGGYFSIASGVKDVVVRQKNAFDGATPNGNGIMLEVLMRLWLLTGKDHYRDRALRLERAFGGEVRRNIFPLATYLNAGAFTRDPLLLVLCALPEERPPFLSAIASTYTPDLVLQMVLPGQALPDNHPAAGKTGTAPAAYLCQGQRCSLPLTNAEELEERLRARYKEA